jgi:hypothetical protein
VDVLDGPHEPIGRHFARVNAFVAAARAAGGTVLVHCHGGVSRAAALVLAFLIGREGLGFDDALAALRVRVSELEGSEARLRVHALRTCVTLVALIYVVCAANRALYDALPDDVIRAAMPSAPFIARPRDSAAFFEFSLSASCVPAAGPPRIAS